MNIVIKRMFTVIIPLLIIDAINAFYVLAKTYGGFDAGAAGDVYLRNDVAILLFFSIIHLIVLIIGIMLIAWLNKDVFYVKLAISRAFILFAIIPLWLLTFGFTWSGDVATRLSIVFTLMDLAKFVFFWLPLTSYLIFIPLLFLHERKEKNQQFV